MNKKNDNEFIGMVPFSTEGMVAPFGDNFDDEIANNKREVCRCEKGYEKLCKECRVNTPEAMKGFISSDYCDLDEIYYCNWNRKTQFRQPSRARSCR